MWDPEKEIPKFETIAPSQSLEVRMTTLSQRYAPDMTPDPSADGLATVEGKGSFIARWKLTFIGSGSLAAGVALGLLIHLSSPTGNPSNSTGQAGNTSHKAASIYPLNFDNFDQDGQGSESLNGKCYAQNQATDEQSEFNEFEEFED